ncbi:MAG TPA: Clp protease N-terminal domain-containing protein [Fimbriimonas sp.]|nr:Clp protease N-terminal domain-containing protein [Fimbriimonas sp.]
MWQRFTEGARKSAFCALNQAHKLGSGQVTTVLLMVGVLRVEGSIAAKVLQHLGVDLELFRSELEKRLQHKEAGSNGDVTLSPRSKIVIEFAYEEAKIINNRYIGTEHLLLGFIREGDGKVALILRDFGVTLEAARLKIQELQDKQGNAPRTNWSDSSLFQIRAVHPLFQDGSKYPLISELFLAILNDSEDAIVAILDAHKSSRKELKSEVIRLLLNK